MDPLEGPSRVPSPPRPDLVVLCRDDVQLQITPAVVARIFTVSTSFVNDLIGVQNNNKNGARARG